VRATSYEPTGITDPVPSNNTDQLSITIPNVVIPACPEVDVEAVVSGSAAPWVYGTPVTYEITHTNYGSDSANG